MGYFSDVIADARGRSGPRAYVRRADFSFTQPEIELPARTNDLPAMGMEGDGAVPGGEPRAQQKKAPAPEQGAVGRPERASTSDTWAERNTTSVIAGTVREDGLSAPIVSVKPASAPDLGIRTNLETGVRRKAGSALSGRELSPSAHAMPPSPVAIVQPTSQGASPAPLPAARAASRSPIEPAWAMATAERTIPTSDSFPMNPSEGAHQATPAISLLPDIVTRPARQAADVPADEHSGRAMRPTAAVRLGENSAASSPRSSPLRESQDTARPGTESAPPLVIARVQPVEKPSPLGRHEANPLPRILIGTIEVVVEAPTPAASSAVALRPAVLPADGLASRRYLKRL